MKGNRAVESPTAETQTTAQSATEFEVELRTAPQVGKQLGNKSEVTLWRWINDPELGFPKPVKIRGQLYFNGAAIDRWIESQMEAA